MRTGVTRVALAAAAAAVLSTIHGRASLRFEHAPFWRIDPKDYLVTGSAPRFPETALLAANGDRDIGIAFSGGGTRSAAATIGELRGLEESGLLTHARYVSAVSGGAWALIPWTFVSGRNAELVGAYEEPGSLSGAAVKTIIHGTLAEAVQGVSIELEGTREGALIAWAFNVAPESQGLLNVVRPLLKGAATIDRTYASLLGHALLKRLGKIDGDDFQLDEAHDSEYTFLNGGPRLVAAAKPQPDRPFMIINADVVNAGADFAYPLAIPFEFTPLYVGARQSVGGVFGGVYTWPSAYNAATARVVLRENDLGDGYCAKVRSLTGSPTDEAACNARRNRAKQQGYSGILEYSHDDDHAHLTLPDVAASRGILLCQERRGQDRTSNAGSRYGASQTQGRTEAEK